MIKQISCRDKRLVYLASWITHLIMMFALIYFWLLHPAGIHYPYKRQSALAIFEQAKSATLTVHFSTSVVLLILFYFYAAYQSWKWQAESGFIFKNEGPKIYAYLIVNFCEEFVFRGTLLFILSRHDLRWALVALPLQAIFWGLCHINSINHHGPITNKHLRIRLVDDPIHGLIYGLIAIFSGGILISWALHVATNISADSDHGVFKTMQKRLAL